MIIDHVDLFGKNILIFYKNLELNTMTNICLNGSNNFTPSGFKMNNQILSIILTPLQGLLNK